MGGEVYGGMKITNINLIAKNPIIQAPTTSVI
jgi:hypothetical protein